MIHRTPGVASSFTSFTRRRGPAGSGLGGTALQRRAGCVAHAFAGDVVPTGALEVGEVVAGGEPAVNHRDLRRSRHPRSPSFTSSTTWPCPESGAPHRRGCSIPHPEPVRHTAANTLCHQGICHLLRPECTGAGASSASSAASSPSSASAYSASASGSSSWSSPSSPAASSSAASSSGSSSPGAPPRRSRPGWSRPGWSHPRRQPTPRPGPAAPPRGLLVGLDTSLSRISPRQPTTSSCRSNTLVMAWRRKCLNSNRARRPCALRRLPVRSNSTRSAAGRRR
jgi:hypothetical protein